MKIVVDINHPANVHYFKNFIREMEKRGHEILITASEKEISYTLLDKYGFSYVKIGSYGKSILEKIINVPILDIKMYQAVKKFQPDLFIGHGSIRAAHVSKILGKPCIATEDTEHAKWEHLLYVPFTDAILTPSCFKKDFGRKQIRYNGYTELQYLHPNRFTPNPLVLDEIGLKEGDPFIIIRFVSWEAGHDIGQHGIQDKGKLIKTMEKYGRVFISSEENLPSEFESYRIHVSPEKIHDLLAYSSLYIGEGATMATEAALLGTPSIFVSTLASSMGNFVELEKGCNILYRFSDNQSALDKAEEILKNPMSKKIWRAKQKQLLKDKIDLTAFIVWFIEEYPQSFTEIKERPQILDSHFLGL